LRALKATVEDIFNVGLVNAALELLGAVRRCTARVCVNWGGNKRNAWESAVGAVATLVVLSNVVGAVHSDVDSAVNDS